MHEDVVRQGMSGFVARPQICSVPVVNVFVPDKAVLVTGYL